jgi:hypothetical protein
VTFTISKTSLNVNFSLYALESIIEPSDMPEKKKRFGETSSTGDDGYVKNRFQGKSLTYDPGNALIFKKVVQNVFPPVSYICQGSKR